MREDFTNHNHINTDLFLVDLNAPQLFHVVMTYTLDHASYYGFVEDQYETIDLSILVDMKICETIDDLHQGRDLYFYDDKKQVVFSYHDLSRTITIAYAFYRPLIDEGYLSLLDYYVF